MRHIPPPQHKHRHNHQLNQHRQQRRQKRWAYCSRSKPTPMQYSTGAPCGIPSSTPRCCGPITIPIPITILPAAIARMIPHRYGTVCACCGISIIIMRSCLWNFVRASSLAITITLLPATLLPAITMEPARMI